MTAGLALVQVRQQARRLQQAFGGCAGGRVPVEKIAASLGVVIVVAPLEGAGAQLVRRGARTHIVLAERIEDPAARRFSIAHELGHFILEHPLRSLDPMPNTDQRDYEREANAFAAELLMPAEVLRPRCEAGPAGLEVPRQIASEFGVSILASAIRFAELSSAPCAVVLSSRGEVVWSAVSRSFPARIPRGHQVRRRSVAGEFFATGVVPDPAQEVPSDAWFDVGTGSSLMEQAIASGTLGTVLSMLWPLDAQDAAPSAATRHAA